MGISSTKKYHFLYETTNIKNGKKYVGIHSTNNMQDGYLGSGKLLTLAIKKYGKKSFQVKILEFAKNRKELIQLEINTITDQIINNSDYYNCCQGGGGGDQITDKKAHGQKISSWRQKLTKEQKDDMIKQQNASREENRITWSKDKKLHFLEKCKMTTVVQWQNYTNNEKTSILEKIAAGQKSYWNNLSPEKKAQRMEIVTQKNRDTKIFHFTHISGDTFSGTRNNFMKKYNLCSSAISCLVSGKYKSTKGWRLSNGH